MTNVKITKRVVDATAPNPKGEQFVWDAELRGFGLRVLPTGGKSYVLQYRTGGRGSQARRRVIGRHGVLTPDQARDRARRLLADIADGSDPGAERDQERQALTVADLADLYLAEGPEAKPNKKASSWATDRSNIERHIKPLLGRKATRSLTQAEIARFQAEIAAGKSKADIKTRKRGRAIVVGGRGTAARSLAVLGAMLQFAVNRKLIAANPAKGVPLLKAQPKERFLSEAEVAQLADAIGTMEGSSLSATAAAAIRLLLLSGCRKSEILSLRWAWVDIDRGCLRLPDSKTGAKTVPLAAAALEVLAGLPRQGEFVLPAGRGAGGHYTGLQKDWQRVRERAGLPGVRVHDLRHSFASFAIADGNTLFMVGKVLGHKQARTTEGYAHLAPDPVRGVADRTGARIAAAMQRRGGDQGSNIVPIKAR